MSLSFDQVYSGWKARAETSGWKLPPTENDPPCGKRAWVLYWAACADHEEHPQSTPRPVVPHRSGGGEAAR